MLVVCPAGWDSWGASAKPSAVGSGSKLGGAKPAAGGVGSLNKQHSVSSPSLNKKADDDDWGKW